MRKLHCNIQVQGYQVKAHTLRQNITLATEDLVISLHWRLSILIGDRVFSFQWRPMSYKRASISSEDLDAIEKKNNTIFKIIYHVQTAVNI